MVHEYGGRSGRVLIDVASVDDARAYSVALVLGQASTDPEDGSALGMAMLRGTSARGQPVAVTNTRIYGASIVEDVATAEAWRQITLRVDVEVTAPGNVLLERYDVMALTVEAWGWERRLLRVLDIVEIWDRGRLTQRIQGGLLP